jgi:hypothetical protein
MDASSYGIFNLPGLFQCYEVEEYIFVVATPLRQIILFYVVECGENYIWSRGFTT